MSSTREAAPGPSRIGVFDSGVGGLTVLAALRLQLPGSTLLYAADSAYAPYGERDAAYVQERSLALTRFLLSQGAQAIVVACNTATALAIAELRRVWPQVPFIGIEPAIKPALAMANGRPVGVLATPATLSSPRFQALLQAHANRAEVLVQPCPGLAEAIETRGPDSVETVTLVRRFCAPLREADCATVVLGCTHYPLIAPALHDALDAPARPVDLVDPAHAVAAQTERILGTLPPTNGAPAHEGTLQAWTNGNSVALERVAKACGLNDLGVYPIPAAR